MSLLKQPRVRRLELGVFLVCTWMYGEGGDRENGSGVTCGRCDQKLGDRLNKGGKKKKMCFGFLEFF